MLSIKPFRRLWVALSLSSLGDWLSILALTALAAELTGKHTAGESTAGAMATQSAAIGGVWLATLLPALLLGPVAGAIADRLDRRMTMIIGDVVRGLLFLSIPLFPNLTWIYISEVPGRLSRRCSGIRPRPHRYRTWCRRTSWSALTSSAC